MRLPGGHTICAFGCVSFVRRFHLGRRTLLRLIAGVICQHEHRYYQVHSPNGNVGTMMSHVKLILVGQSRPSSNEITVLETGPKIKINATPLGQQRTRIFVPQTWFLGNAEQQWHADA